MDPPTQAYVRLSPLAAELGSRLATRTFDEACEELAAYLDRPRTAVREALADACYRSPTTAGWVDDATTPRRVTGSSQAFLPISATLQLTNVCNLGCTFCYASSGRPLPNELDTGAWRGILETLANHGTTGATLTGGEPTLRRDILELTQLASRLFASVSIFTNGFTTSPDLLDLLGTLGNVEAQVSIDGTEAEHDRLRARDGSFAAALDTVRQLRARGVPVLVSTTVMADNAHTLEPVAEAVAEAGATVLKFGGLQSHVGRGDRHTSASSPEAKLVERISAIAERHRGRLLVLPWERCETPLMEHLTGLVGERTESMHPGYLHWYVTDEGSSPSAGLTAAASAAS